MEFDYQTIAMIEIDPFLFIGRFVVPNEERKANEAIYSFRTPDECAHSLSLPVFRSSPPPANMDIIPSAIN